MRYISRSRFPFKTTKAGDVGHDLYADVYGMKWTRLDKFVTRFLKKRAIVILPFTNRAVATGVFLALDNWTWAKIEARSSTSKKRMQTLGGIIDSGYRGEMFAVLHNSGLIPRIIRDGERYAQVIFHTAVRPELTRVERFTDTTARGETGFGSSGK